MKEFMLIGNPVGHSSSPDLFNRMFERNGVNARYRAVCLDSIDHLPLLVKDNTLLAGLNVTSPFKREVIPYLDGLSPEAEMLGAVNVIKVADGHLYGYNTDIYGFMSSVAATHTLLCPDTALILGTGGAASAVKLALSRLGWNSISVSHSGKTGTISYEDIDSTVMAEVSMIVNATPVGMGMLADQAPQIPYNLLTSRHFCHDLIYNPEETLFMKLSEERGARVKNGLDMLIGQAKAAWNIWNDLDVFANVEF